MIFAGPSGILERIDEGFSLRMPEQPTFWWGNAIAFDRPPKAGDHEHWMALFARHIADRQPESLHRTFSWPGIDRGFDHPFLRAGFESIEHVILAAEPTDRIVAPHAVDDSIVGIDDALSWLEVQDLLVQTRLVQQSFEAYRRFIERRIAGWRTLIGAGQGAWFGVRREGRLVATLGVFVESRPGADGRLIGRFQHVATHPAARHAGIAGTLVAHATRVAFERLRADRLVVVADERDSARRVYESVGYRATDHQRGLERVGLA
jgi:ribosomal protein S18 acetylase RimI-like enzyme